jgi:excinuclease ABC subunit A
VKKLSNEEILTLVLKMVDDARKSGSTKKAVMGVSISDAKVTIASPVVVGRKGEYYQLLYDMLNKGYERAIIDGKQLSLRERIELSKTKKHHIDIVVDEIYLSEFKDDAKGSRERASEAIERALHESDGLVKIVAPDGSERIASSKFMCPHDGFSFPEVEPRLFSFNSPYGACPECNGLGTKFLFGDEPCEACNGARLRPEALNVFLGGTPPGEGGSGKNIVEVASLSIEHAAAFFEKLSLTKKRRRNFARGH